MFVVKILTKIQRTLWIDDEDLLEFSFKDRSCKYIFYFSHIVLCPRTVPIYIFLRVQWNVQVAVFHSTIFRCRCPKIRKKKNLSRIINVVCSHCDYKMFLFSEHTQASAFDYKMGAFLLSRIHDREYVIKWHF